jgi:ribosome maturation factor RimP
MTAVESQTLASEPFLEPFTGVEEQLRAIIEPVVNGAGLELVVLVLVRSKTQDLLRLSVDRPHAGVTPGKGVAMGELEQLNRLLGDLLDVEDNTLKLFKERWELEVGSPGVDRPLTKKSHFRDVIGQKVKARLKLQAKSLVGKLEAADEDGFVVDGERAAFADLDHAHVVFEFHEPGKPGKGSKPGKPGKKKK